MDKIKRVNILHAELDEQRDLVTMKLEDQNAADNDEYKVFTIAWPGDDLGHAIGVDSYIPRDIMKDFLNQMIGKTINLQMKADMSDVDMSTMGSDSLAAAKGVENFNKYPWDIVEDKIRKES